MEDRDYVGINRENNIYAVIGREEIQSEPWNKKIEHDYVNTFPKELAFISISDPKKPFIKTNNHFDSELFMKFWDVEEEDGKYCPIHITQAKEIYDFIYKNRNKEFLVNCEAGVSRSAGIGMAIEFLLRDKKEFPKWSHFPSKIIQHWRYSPNMNVFNSIISFETTEKYFASKGGWS